MATAMKIETAIDGILDRTVELRSVHSSLVKGDYAYVVKCGKLFQVDLPSEEAATKIKAADRSQYLSLHNYK